jgi:AraC-like DNA-binding protein
LRKEASLSIRLLWPFVRLRAGDARGIATIERAGVNPADFADPDARIPHRIAMRILEETVEYSGDLTIGLRAGAQVESGDFYVFEYAARTCATLEESLQCSARYFRLLNDAAEISLEIGKEVATWRYRVIDGVEEPPAANDFAVSSSLSFSRRNTVEYEPPLEVHLVHARPSYAAEYERAFEAPVKFGAPFNAIVMKRSRLSTPMRQANAGISAAFELHAARLVERLRGGEGTVGRVREEVAAQLGRGSVSMELTAKHLGMSIATLRRRLESEDATFSSIVEDLRRRLAEQYLREPEQAVSEIAFLLGFSNVTAFDRAFKRWNGISPTAYRAKSRIQ